jgi:hypothetical protein
VIAFNTLINNATQYLMSGRTDGLGATNTTFSNNILQGGTTGADINGPYSGAVWSGNILWNVGSAGDIPSSGFTNVNPLLAVDANGVFHLQSGSPAINSATGTFSSVTVDMDGQPRSAPKDKGADEVSTAAVTAKLLTPNDVGPGPSCVTASGNTFQNSPMTSQTGSFTAEYDATPSVTPANGYVALSQGTQTAHTGFAVIARFNPDGNIDARNGAAYGAAGTIPYSTNVKYHFRLVVNVASHTYSVFVTPAGGSETTVATNFSFRSEQSGVTSLNNWATWAQVGSVTACGFGTH